MDERFSRVITKLNDLRNQLDPEEQKVLDLIVGATDDDDEVEAHRLTPKAYPRFDLRITNRIYQVIEK